MSRASHQIFDDDQNHAILAEAWTYAVCGLRMEFGQTTSLDDWLEMTLVRDRVSISLRFEGVRGLSIDEGFPHLHPRLRILDISDRGWDHVTVSVQGVEDGAGIRFFARSVERIADTF